MVDGVLFHVLGHATDTVGWEELLVLVWLEDVADSVDYLLILVVLTCLVVAS